MRRQLCGFLSATAAVLALCWACTRDIEPSCGTLDAPQALVFSASQGDLALSTRAAADGTWDGGESVAIKIGDDVKQYTVVKSGGACTLEPYDSDNTFYRTDKSSIAITAWYPYSASQPSAPDIRTDQSTKTKREAGNLMTASATAVFGKTTTLTFSHQTALIRVSVTGEDGSPVTNATVKILGITACNEGSGSYSALVLPQNLNADSDFISITIDSATYLYKLAEAKTFGAGSSYAYSLTLQSPDNTDYFYVEALASGVTVSMKSTGSYAPAISLLYSTDGSSWKTFTVNETSVTLSKSGDKVWFKAGSANKQIGWSDTSYNSFVFTGNVSVGGDITSLLSADGGIEDISNSSSYGTRTLANLFYSATTLVSAENLSLPSTTLRNYCYSNMFYGCTSLTTAPKLPAETLKTGCYQYMFYGCTSLKPAPELPATTLASSCYSYMFYGCTSLNPAPELPATTLASSCYKHMFYGCTSLEESPVLPATELVSNCYEMMFSYCSKLSKVTIKAETKPSSSPIMSWLREVKSSGTIYYTNQTFINGLTANSEGGIPSGWSTKKLTD